MIDDLNLLGFIFESMVVRDLRIYSQPMGGEVRQYLDNKGLEVDAIIQAADSWAAFEVKLGGKDPIEEAASSLKKFAGEVDTSKSGDPALLGVIVATGYGYERAGRRYTGFLAIGGAVAEGDLPTTASPLYGPRAPTGTTWIPSERTYP